MPREVINPSRVPEQAPRKSGAPIAKGTPEIPISPARLARRRRSIRARRMSILVALSVGLGLEASVAALTSPAFGVDRIVVRSAQPLPVSEARMTADTVRLPAGVNLFRAPLSQMERQLRSLPWVQTASVRWVSPHALGVQFKPREPALIAAIGGRDYEFDATGVPIRAARREMAPRLPRLEMERPIEVRPGTPVTEEGLLAALRIYRDASSQPMVRIAKIRVDPAGNMCLNMVDGIQVQLGQPERLAEKLSYVQRVYQLDANPASRLVAINLSYLKQPACTLKTDLPVNPGISDKSTPRPDEEAAGDAVSL